MEKWDDTTTEGAVVGKNKYLSFTFLYWLAVIVFIVIFSWKTGKDRLSKYEFTRGKVVDKVLLRARKRTDAYFAQWQYTVGEDTFLFVDKLFFNRVKSIGSERPVIYLRDKHDEARVYSFAFWINLPFLLITFMITIFIFTAGQFIIHWNNKAWFAKWLRKF